MVLKNSTKIKCKSALDGWTRDVSKPVRGRQYAMPRGADFRREVPSLEFDLVRRNV